MRECRETKRSKGIAYILFKIPEDAVRASKELDMTIFQVREGNGPGARCGFLCSTPRSYWESV